MQRTRGVGAPLLHLGDALELAQTAALTERDDDPFWREFGLLVLEDQIRKLGLEGESIKSPVDAARDTAVAARSTCTVPITATPSMKSPYLISELHSRSLPLDAHLSAPTPIPIANSLNLVFLPWPTPPLSPPNTFDTSLVFKPFNSEVLVKEVATHPFDVRFSPPHHDEGTGRFPAPRSPELPKHHHLSLGGFKPTPAPPSYAPLSTPTRDFPSPPPSPTLASHPYGLNVADDDDLETLLGSLQLHAGRIIAPLAPPFLTRTSPPLGPRSKPVRTSRRVKSLGGRHSLLSDQPLQVDIRGRQQARGSFVPARAPRSRAAWFQDDAASASEDEADDPRFVDLAAFLKPRKANCARRSFKRSFLSDGCRLVALSGAKARRTGEGYWSG